MNNNFTFCAVFRNEAPRVRYVLDWASRMFSDIIIVVQKSEDGTEDICREYTENVFSHPAQSPEESKDFIMERVKTPWTFWLDADEFPSKELEYQLMIFGLKDYDEYDSISYKRRNYINGFIIEANEGEDRQFRALRSNVRWDPKSQGRRIHINPLVKNPLNANAILYHHRTLEKIEKSTKRWNELEPQTKEACDLYLKKVKEELNHKGGEF